MGEGNGRGVPGEEEMGRRIREARLRAGLTQVQLADRVGVSQRTISDYERNTTTPDPDTMRKLARTLGISVAYIYGEEDAGVLSRLGVRLRAYEEDLSQDEIDAIVAMAMYYANRRRRREHSNGT